MGGKNSKDAKNQPSNDPREQRAQPKAGSFDDINRSFAAAQAPKPAVSPSRAAPEVGAKKKKKRLFGLGRKKKDKKLKVKEVTGTPALETSPRAAEPSPPASGRRRSKTAPSDVAASSSGSAKNEGTSSSSASSSSNSVGTPIRASSSGVGNPKMRPPAQPSSAAVFVPSGQGNFAPSQGDVELQDAAQRAAAIARARVGEAPLRGLWRLSLRLRRPPRDCAPPLSLARPNRVIALRTDVRWPHAGESAQGVRGDLEAGRDGRRLDAQARRLGRHRQHGQERQRGAPRAAVWRGVWGGACGSARGSGRVARAVARSAAVRRGNAPRLSRHPLAPRAPVADPRAAQEVQGLRGAGGACGGEAIPSPPLRLCSTRPRRGPLLPQPASPPVRPRPPVPRQVQAAAREMLEEGGNPKGRSDKAKLKKDKTLAPVRV